MVLIFKGGHEMRNVAILAHDFEALSHVCELFGRQGFISCLVPLRDWYLYIDTLHKMFAVVLDEADLKCDKCQEYVMDLEEYLLGALNEPRKLVLEKDGDHHIGIQAKGRTDIWTHQFRESLQEDFLYGFCHSNI